MKTAFFALAAYSSIAAALPQLEISAFPWNRAALSPGTTASALAPGRACADGSSPSAAATAFPVLRRGMGQLRGHPLLSALSVGWLGCPARSCPPVPGCCQRDPPSREESSRGFPRRLRSFRQQETQCWRGELMEMSGRQRVYVVMQA